MSRNYDNWERLVAAVMLRMKYLELALRSDSSSSSNSFISASDDDVRRISSTFSEFQLDVASSASHVPQQLPMDYSDLVLDHNMWKSMLPHGEKELLYKSACVRFFLDEDTGKNCFLLGASKLDFTGWKDSLLLDFNDIFEWEMKSNTKSRFLEVAGLKGLVEIHCNINILSLTPDTRYAVYLVLILADQVEQETPQTTASYYLLQSTSEHDTSNVVNFEEANDRVDGCKELAVGEVYVGLEGKGSIGGDHEIVDGQLAIKVCIFTLPTVTSQVLVGKIMSTNRVNVEGIEFRPLTGNNNNATKRNGIFPKSTIYSDMVLNHNAWKAMLPAGENKLLCRPASMSFFLDMKTGKNCFLVAASQLHLRREILERKRNTKSRFSKVVELLNVQYTFYTQYLTPNTRYALYLVIGLADHVQQEAPYIFATGWIYHRPHQYPINKFEAFKEANDRSDGWKEIPLCEFYVGHGVKGKKAGKRTTTEEELLIHLTIDTERSFDVEHLLLAGELSSGEIIFEGIEFRPLQEEHNSNATPKKPHGIFSRFRKM